MRAWMPDRLLELQHRLIDLRDALDDANMPGFVLQLSDVDFELLSDAAMVLHHELYPDQPMPSHGDWMPKRRKRP